MPKLNVILRKEDLNSDFLYDKVAVIIDVLFATSTIVTALHHGATAVQAHLNAQQASQAIKDLEEHQYLLAGEERLNKIAGFAGYSPLSLTPEALRGRELVYCTTNGTVALQRANCALHVYAAALLNAPAVAQRLAAHDGLSLVLVCAGTAGRVNIEDLYAAGYLIELLERLRPGHWQPTDTTTIARAIFRQYAGDPVGCLLSGQLARSFDEALREEVRYAAQVGLIDIVPTLDGRRLVAA